MKTILAPDHRHPQPPPEGITMKTITHPVCPGHVALLLSCLFLLTLAAVGPDLCAANASPPDRLTYQGYVVDTEGKPLGSTNTGPRNYDMIFKIYASQSGGATLWQEKQTVTVDNGYFSILLGEGVNPTTGLASASLAGLFAGANASDRFVEITVEKIGTGGANSTIAPRLRLLTSPYAFLATRATELVDGAGASYVSSTSIKLPANSTIEATSFKGSGALLTSLSASQIPNLGAEKITSGTFSSADRIPNLDASKITSGTLGTNVMKNLRLYNVPLYLRHGTDTGHGLGFFGTDSGGSKFASVNVDGPVLFGYSGGGLGTRQGTTEKLALQWTSAGNVTFGGTITGNGSELTGLTASQIPNLAASKITTGIIDDARIPSSIVRGDTSKGKTFRVIANYAEVYHETDKAKTSAWWRSNNGFNFDAVGGTSQGGSAARTVTYDGDSDWNFSSDRRLKTDIVDAESVLKRVMAVKMRRFRWIGGNPDTHPELGVIAQEFQPLFPELIGRQAPDPSTPACPDGAMTVGVTSLGTIAIKAIQELKQEKDGEIAGLKKENELLRARVEQLSRQIGQVANLEQQLAELKKLVARAVELRREERLPAGRPVASTIGTRGNQ